MTACARLLFCVAWRHRFNRQRCRSCESLPGSRRDPMSVQHGEFCPTRRRLSMRVAGRGAVGTSQAGYAWSGVPQACSRPGYPTCTAPLGLAPRCPIRPYLPEIRWTAHLQDRRPTRFAEIYDKYRPPLAQPRIMTSWRPADLRGAANGALPTCPYGQTVNLRSLAEAMTDLPFHQALRIAIFKRSTGSFADEEISLDPARASWQRQHRLGRLRRRWAAAGRPLFLQSPGMLGDL